MSRLISARITDEQRKCLTRAIERRFGASVMPYQFTSVSEHVVRATDTESGSWIEGDFSSSRLRVIALHDGEFQSAPAMVAQPVQQAQADASKPEHMSDEERRTVLLREAANPNRHPEARKAYAEMAERIPVTRRSAADIAASLPNALVAAYRHHRAHRLAFPPHDKRTRSDGRTASAALTFARLDVANATTRFPGNPDAHAWGGRTNGKTRWIESPADCGLRFVGYADKLSRSIDHTGWHSDTDGHSSIRGVVYQLPARDGRPLYIAGHDNDENGLADAGGPAFLDFGSMDYGAKGGTWNETGSDARDAAHMADRLSELTAERERDYNEAWQAGLRYSDLGEEYRDKRKAVRAVLSEVRAATGDKYRATLTRAAMLRDFVSARCKLLGKRERLFHDFYNTDGFREHLS